MAELAQYRLHLENVKKRYKERYQTDEEFRNKERARINESNKKRYHANPEIKELQRVRAKIYYDKKRLLRLEQMEDEKLNSD